MTIVLVTSVAMVVSKSCACAVTCLCWLSYKELTKAILELLRLTHLSHLAGDTVARAAAPLTMTKPTALERAIANERGVSASNQHPALATTSGCSYCQRFGFI